VWAYLNKAALLRKCIFHDFADFFTASEPGNVANFIPCFSEVWLDVKAQKSPAANRYLTMPTGENGIP
jgi:hypothetical protein